MKKEYYINIDGQIVPVTETVYREYKRPQWREAKRKKVSQKRELSLEYMTETGMEHIYSDKQKLVEEIAEDNLMLETLTDDERFLINELYFNEKSERDLANITGISQPAVHKRRNKILEKIKKLMK